MKKENLRQLIIEHLDNEWRTQNNAADLARDEATHDESRAESKYDTHGQEAAYLAEGQARLAAEIALARSVYQTMPFPDFGPANPVTLGALICLETSEGKAWYFIGPKRGGMQLRLDDTAIMVITPQSTLGAKLTGSREGDVLTLPNGIGHILRVQ